MEDVRGHALLRAREIAAMLKSKYSATAVVLFGSFASGKHDRYSDLDIAIRGVEPRLFYRAAGEATAIQNEFSVDIVDLDDCPAPFRDSVVREGIPL